MLQPAERRHVRTLRIEWGRGNLAFPPHATEASPTNGEAANICLDVSSCRTLGKW